MLNSPGTARQSALHHGPITGVVALREAQLQPLAHVEKRRKTHVFTGHVSGKWKCLVYEETMSKRMITCVDSQSVAVV